MPKPQVRLNSAGVVALLNAPGLIADMQSRMGRVVAQAQASAPLQTGAYRDSIHMRTERHGDRTVVQVVADVPYAMTVEASTGNLANALDAAGGEGDFAPKVRVRYTTKAGKTIWATQAQVDNWTRGR